MLGAAGLMVINGPSLRGQALWGHVTQAGGLL